MKEFVFSYVLLCDIFSKYAWIVPLKDKRRVTITNAFQKTLDDFKMKQNICG